MKNERFFRSKKQFLNNVNNVNVNTGINSSTVSNESKNDNLNMHDQDGSTNATSMFARSTEMFSVSPTSLVSSSKVEDLEEESPKRKKNISGNRIIDVNIPIGVFGEMLPYVSLQFISFL